MKPLDDNRYWRFDRVSFIFSNHQTFFSSLIYSYFYGLAEFFQIWRFFIRYKLDLGKNSCNISFKISNQAHLVSPLFVFNFPKVIQNSCILDLGSCFYKDFLSHFYFHFYEIFILNLRSIPHTLFLQEPRIFWMGVHDNLYSIF